MTALSIPLISAGCLKQEANHAEPSLMIRPDPVELGIVRSGEIRKARFKVRNTTNKTLEIDRIHTSCPCSQISPDSLVIASGQESELNVVFDTSKEPEFVGDLGIEFEFISDGVSLVKGHVNVAVRSF